MIANDLLNAMRGDARRWRNEEWGAGSSAECVAMVDEAHSCDRVSAFIFDATTSAPLLIVGVKTTEGAFVRRVKFTQV